MIHRSLSILTSLFFLLTFTTAQAKELVPLEADFWLETVTVYANKPAFLFITDKNCKECPAMQKLIEEAADLRGDVDFYIMNKEQLPLPSEMVPYVLFSVPGQNDPIRGHGWVPHNVQDVMIFIAQRLSYASREEVLEARLRGMTARKKIRETDKADSFELRELAREVDLLGSELTGLRVNNKLNAFGRNR